MRPEDIIEEDIKSADLVHVGSISSYEFDNSRRTMKRVLKLAKKYEKPVSFDPNLREALSKDPLKAFSYMQELFESSSLRKLSAGELLFYAYHHPKISYDGSEVDYSQLVKIGRELNRKFPCSALLITLGEAGAIGFSKNGMVNSSSYNFGETVNTIGAGDAFMAGAIKKLIENPNGKLEEMLDYSCRISGISVTEDRTVALKVRKEDELTGSKRYEGIEFIDAVNKQLISEFEFYKSFNRSR